MTGSLPHTRIARWAVPAILALGLALSVVGGVLADRHVREKADDRLNALADLAAGRVAEHIAQFAGLTRALQASFLDLSVMPAVKFREYVGILRLHAGTQSVQSYVFAEQQGGDLHIRHAEPAAGNEGLPGLRISANPAAAVALDRLRAEGALSATLPFALERSSSGAPSMAFLAPVYLTETQPPRFAVKGRRLAGVVAITVNLDRLLAPLTAQLREQQVRLRVAAVPSAEAGASAVPFHSGNDAALQGGARYAAQRDVEVQDTKWRLTLEAGPDLILFPERDLALIVPAVLLTLTLLLAALAHALVRSRRLAQRHAEEVTRDLRQSEARFRDLAELSSDWYWEQDAQFRFTHMSVGVFNKSGVNTLSTLGKARWELPIEGVSEAEWAAHRAQLERHEPFQDLTYQMRTADRGLRWFSISGRPVYDTDGRFAGYRGTGRDITERKHQEAGILEARNQLEATLDAIPDLLFEMSLDGRYLDCHSPRDDLLAAPAEDLIGSKVSEMLPPEAASVALSALWEAHEHGHSHGMQFALQLPQGKRWFELSVSRKPEIAGGQPSFIVLSRDITDRKQSESDLRKERDFAKNLIGTAPVIILLLDMQGAIQHVNPYFEQLTGYRLDEVKGREWLTTFIPERDRERIRALFESATDGVPTRGNLNPIVIRSGKERDVEWYDQAMRDDRGVITSVLAIGLDVTERRQAEIRLKQAEQALLGSEAMLSKAQEVAQTGSWILDMSSGKLEWSRETYRIFGVAPGTPVSYELFVECLHQDDRKAVDDAWKTALQGSPYDIEHRIVVEGGFKWVRERAELMFDEESRLVRAIGTVQDITKLKSAEQEIRQLNEGLEQRVRERTAELESSNRELEAFSYSVSHDLRAPLRGIDGFAQILAEDYGSRLDDAGRGHLERIRKASQRLSQTIDDIIELARITRMPLNRREVDLSSMARTILLELSQHSRHRPEIVIAEAVTAQADPALLRIVLENLLDNAWKFTSRTDPARIEFGTREIDGERAYFIRDNGAGFDPAYADKLFLPFQRLHRPDEFAGTGIGLATVQRIIQRHGGRVRAEGSRGAGAAIYFTLP